MEEVREWDLICNNKNVVSIYCYDERTELKGKMLDLFFRLFKPPPVSYDIIHDWKNTYKNETNLLCTETNQLMPE